MWRCEDVRRWKFEDVEMYRFDLKVWRCEDVQARKCQDVNTATKHQSLEGKVDDSSRTPVLYSELKTEETRMFLT